MSVCVKCVVLFSALLGAHFCEGRKGVGGTEQDWGYVTVRPNAHMFWWLYYTTYNASNYTDRPLIIWLQGGPGMPSSGYGNFVEIGPHNVNFEAREGSFVENFNVLFIDNPVGVGYSYFSEPEMALVTNGQEIGRDLYSFFKIFITQVHPEFKTVPIYVFGESYGGKMAIEFVHRLKQKEKSEGLKMCNLKGVGLGDAYISPIDYIKHYASFVLNLGFVDRQGFKRIDELANQIRGLIAKKEFQKAADVEVAITDFLSTEAFVFDMYNFFSKTNSPTAKFWDYMNVLESIMNDRVKNELNITANVTWRFFQDDLYDSLKGDLIRSVVHKVEALLNSTDVKIIVYNGILDFLVNTAGTLSWLGSLDWEGKDRWFNATQSNLLVDDVNEGYSKRVDNLVFYAVLRAGHSVPFDNLPVMNKILEAELLS